MAAKAHDIQCYPVTKMRLSTLTSPSCFMCFLPRVTLILLGLVNLYEQVTYYPILKNQWYRTFAAFDKFVLTFPDVLKAVFSEESSDPYIYIQIFEQVGKDEFFYAYYEQYTNGTALFWLQIRVSPFQPLKVGKCTCKLYYRVMRTWTRFMKSAIYQRPSHRIRCSTLGFT